MSQYGYVGALDPKRFARFSMNDLGNCKRLIELVGGVVDDEDAAKIDITNATLLYDLGRGWIGYNGKYWDSKYGDELARKSAHKVAELVASNYAVFKATYPKCPDGVLMKWVNGCGSAGQTSNMLTQAKSYLLVEIDAFDRDPLAINCQNGTLKLRWDESAPQGQRFSYRLEPHNAADRITRCADVAYDADAKAVEFTKTLERSIKNADERDAFHRMMGYSSTGEIVEQCFFFNHGKGRDGKSTLLDACRRTLGTYAVVASPLTFLEGGPQAGSGPQPDLISLAGDTRLAIVSEPKRGSILKEGLMKSWTSGVPITARDLNTKPIEFVPRPKLVWEMNNLVKIKGDDDGIWRRLKPVSFRHQVPEDQVDNRLPERLNAERPGILNWLIEGVGRWLESGLEWPESFKDLLKDYRKQSSPFGDWLDECCFIGDAAAGHRETSKALYNNYKNWCEEQGIERPVSTTMFGTALTDRQIAPSKNGAGLKVRGPIRLKTSAEIDAANRAEGTGDATPEPASPSPGGYESTGGSFDASASGTGEWGDYS